MVSILLFKKGWGILISIFIDYLHYIKNLNDYFKKIWSNVDLQNQSFANWTGNYLLSLSLFDALFLLGYDYNSDAGRKKKKNRWYNLQIKKDITQTDIVCVCVCVCVYNVYEMENLHG